MSNLSNARTWVVKHAKEILEHTANYPADRPIILKMGYGPSGLPHLGTVTELIRTCMIAKVLRKLQSKPVVVLSFCDNLDGMRKVPPIVPNTEMLTPYINQPLSRIPDPYMSQESFAEYNINQLKELVETFGYKVHDYKPTKEQPYNIRQALNLVKSGPEDCVILLRASDMYESGSYNARLHEILQNYKKVLDIVLPTLGEERQQTYSPFMPISPTSGKVLDSGVLEYDLENNAITFEEHGHKSTMKVENDNFKLQWKVDFAMQWLNFDVDYEMSGKDIGIGTYPVSRAIIEALGYTPPITPMYEMFLAEDGSKISKTKGNGMSLQDMLKYTSTEVVRHFMFLSPTSAKRLDMQKIPAYIDAFVKDLEAYNKLVDGGDIQNETAGAEIQIPEENPIWYSEHSRVPNPHFNASLLLNLIQSIHPPNVEAIFDFIAKRNITPNELDKKIVQACYNFYHDHYVKPKFEDIPEACKKYLLEFVGHLSEDPLAMQTKLYDLGNQAVAANAIPDLKSWFEVIYKGVIGQKQGPRLGNFFALYGKEESKKLIWTACKYSGQE